MTFSLNNNQEIISRDIALDMLISVFPDLKEQWKNYLAEEYKNYNEERLDYIDIGIVIDYIVEKKKSNETKGFDDFFIRVENILTSGDSYTMELTIIGLLEGIQNVCGSEVNYYDGFDEWLKPKTKKVWLELIEFWEGKSSKLI
ncbi:MAG: hypothetical protein IPK31_06565 [Chitinophagaceae bacterium]|nr:hypothetical protein [Chitinophagaceae bacterium]